MSGDDDVILGQPFLQSRNPIIDWQQRKMTLRKQHRNQENVVVQHCMINALRDIDGTSQPDDMTKEHKYDVHRHRQLEQVVLIKDGKRDLTIDDNVLTSVTWTWSALNRCRRRMQAANDSFHHIQHTLGQCYALNVGMCADPPGLLDEAMANVSDDFVADDFNSDHLLSA